jgi:hypothetical protein
MTDVIYCPVMAWRRWAARAVAAVGRVILGPSTPSPKPTPTPTPTPKPDENKK